MFPLPNLPTPEASSPTSELPLTLGKTDDGEPFVVDLAAMPHILMAGAEGAGKSVALRAMIASLVHRATPGHVRLVLIDDHRRDFDVYEGLPHLLSPVVFEPLLGVNALGWVVREMEERYARLSAAGVRSITLFNQRASPLPFIVIVVSELADLMTVAGPDVERALVRLAQMSRAVGIHVILSTAHTSVGVITGHIKANFPARVALRVHSSANSRTIIDRAGAEELAAPGEMLFLPPMSMHPIRVHGAFVSHEETASLVAQYRQRGTSPISVDSPHITDPAHRLRKPADEDDELYEKAARLVAASGRMSISHLQHALNIGFSRAARLLDRMKEEGLG